MRRVRSLWRRLFDVRPGEYLRTLFMSLYLLCVLFAYYILKPVSRAMFLNKFDIDKLPYLYILIAIGGGILAYLYSKLAVKTSLRTAVFWAMALSVLCLVVMWWLIGMKLPWMLYVLNVWLSLFSVVLVSQGWLVASNLFNSREAKRLYGLLGMGTVLGAAAGGEFTRRTAVLFGTENLLLASAAMVVLAYIAFRLAIAQSGISLTGARAGEAEAADFSFRDLNRDIARNRHLQVIIAIMLVTFIVDALVEYQFQVLAAAHYKGDGLTVFFATFYGLYLNLTEVVFQFFLTSAIVSRFGVGGTLLIMPGSILLASTATALAPSVLATSAVRLTEASTRYTLNRTGMELLYLPLPAELRQRVKAFVDVAVDRLGRGLGGVLLLLCASVLKVGVQGIAVVVIALTIPWILLSFRARKEYVATIRKRLESRRLDLESARVRVEDPETIRMLEHSSAGSNSRQAVYALSLLSEAPDYRLEPLLRKLADSPSPEIRGKVYELARPAGFTDAGARALDEVRADSMENAAAIKPAVACVLGLSAERMPLAKEFLESSSYRVSEAALEALASQPDQARELITHEWLALAAQDPDPQRRALAAQAVGVCGDHGTEALHRLLADPDPLVVAAACQAAGVLRNRSYLYALAQHLANARLRGVVIASLARYGAQICGALGDILSDEDLPLKVRRQVPRVLKLIPNQRSVDVLLRSLGHPDLAIRAAVLKALNRLRETAPELNFEDTFVTSQILKEARYYFELNEVLAPFLDEKGKPRTTAGLLARTIEERLRQALERLFRLLGLRYPPKEIYSAYLAVTRKRSEEVAAALEFLDNVLDRDLKRVLLPLLDAPDHVLEKGRDLFGLEARGAESAIRLLIRSADPWLVACAMAAAAELRLFQLAPAIAEAAREAAADVSAVARSANAVLAA